MIASLKKYFFYICTLIISQAVIFLQQGMAIPSLSLHQQEPITNFSSVPLPVKPPNTTEKITGDPNQILARVNNETITAKDIESLVVNLPPELKLIPKDLLYPQLIKQLIVDHALMITIKNDGVDKQPLIQKSIEIETKNLIHQKLIQAYFVIKLKPLLTPQTIQQYYTEHYLHQAQIKEVHLRQIIVQNLEIAQLVLKKLKGNCSFSNTARLYSIDLQNREKNQGDIGWFDIQALNNATATIISSLKNNEYTQTPLQTDYGWIIFQKVGERIRPIPSLESVRQIIKEQITKETINNLYEESLKNVHIIEY